MDALEAYLVELSANRLAGAVPETSGYGALAALLNEVGQHLKPKVRCVSDCPAMAPRTLSKCLSRPAASGFHRPWVCAGQC